jgi:hypothetical protein
MDRITAIETSLAAFVWGLFGFIPFLGIIPAICALVHWARIRAGFRNEWNPASAYLDCGVILATLGLGISFLIAGALCVEFIS